MFSFWVPRPFLSKSRNCDGAYSLFYAFVCLFVVLLFVCLSCFFFLFFEYVNNSVRLYYSTGPIREGSLICCVLYFYILNALGANLALLL